MTEKQKAIMMELPNYREFIESGDAQRAGRLLSMAYLVASVFHAYTEEAFDLMNEHNLIHKSLKTKSNNLTQSFDSFDKEFRKMISEEVTKELIVDDYQKLRELCDRFMRYDEK